MNWRSENEVRLPKWRKHSKSCTTATNHRKGSWLDRRRFSVFSGGDMSGKNTVVFGIYPNESEIVEGIEHLTRLGFRPADLSIMLPENLGSKDIGHEKHTKAPEGGVAGGFAGAVVGAALGWLT